MDQYCSVCGKPHGPGEAFCQNCGARLAEAAPVYVPAAQQTDAAPAYVPPVSQKQPNYAPQQRVAGYAPNQYRAPAPAQAPARMPAPAAKPKKKKTGLIIGLSAAVVALIAAAALLLFVFMPFSVELSQTSLKLACGETVKLTAEVSPGFSLRKDVTWSSSDPDVAHVSSSGKVTGERAGTCEITATTANGKSASCTVKVKVAPVNILMSESALTVGVGETRVLTAEILPEEAKDANLEWSSSNPAVATVDNGTVTAVSGGTCVITAASSNGISTSCSVTVEEYSVLMVEYQLGLTVGDTHVLKAYIFPESADVSVTWTSSSPSVATVDDKGNVVGVGVGVCDITASLPNGSSACCTVTVTEKIAELEFISLSDYWVDDLKVGDTFALTVTFYPSDATDKTISWRSSNPSVATVDDKGNVTAVGAGSCEIIAAASNGKDSSCHVEVSASAKPASSTQVEVGDILLLGTYEQDNNAYDGKEEIEWLVLDKQGSSVLVVSRYGLDCQLFNGSMSNATWDSCSLRTWLNDTFYYSAFTSQEQSRILNTTVAASGNPSFGTNAGSNTYDKIFLLSISEANWYFGSDAARLCKGTAYCTAQGAYVGNGGNCWWWLRTPGDRIGSAANVGSSGAIHYNGNDADSAAGAVRPAMWITIG
ncbi:MAG: Ig-like domain-containing protein [Oscillospiraceae bacterium]|nr:Ig-like domain-containing protein [Oscillospiraceae bacterium]